MALSFKDYGLKCDQAPAVTKVLRYESAINLTAANLFSGECSVGAFTYVQPHGVFSETSLGRFCSVADWVVTGPGQHHTNLFSTHPFKYDPEDTTAALSQFPAYQALLGRTPITLPFDPSRARLTSAVKIGHDVWIGTRAIIMNGVTVGDGAVIGAGAIVTKDVPPYAVMVGVPARLIRFRFDRAIIDRLLELQWWNYDMSKVSNKVDYGRVEAVIDFMTDRIKAGQLPKFTSKRYELKQNGANYSIGPLPGLTG